MFVSEPPCGDASMIELGSEGRIHWTGAKSVGKEMEDGGNLLIGLCRGKSGRSDLPPDQRSNSMSCSDKILSWNEVGL